ncbi:MAG TPA: class I SAM-dependent methyltransferase [Acidimicrobiales bacterium]|jgi:SAM-dependent methyltransferase
MARVDYTDRAHAYRVARTLPAEVLAAWTATVVDARLPRPELVLDVGAGPGGFVAPLVSWFGAPVVAIEPSPAMRTEARHAGVAPATPYLAARAEALPLRSGAAAGLAWLSTMIHQCDDAGAVAGELRRVLRSGSRVLVRGFFSDLTFTGLLAMFPGIDRAAATFPSTSSTVAVFESAGFSLDGVHDVVEPWRADLPAWLARAHSIRHTDSALRPLHDDEFAEGVRRVTDRYRGATGPVPSDITLRLLVLSG